MTTAYASSVVHDSLYGVSNFASNHGFWTSTSVVLQCNPMTKSFKFEADSCVNLMGDPYGPLEADVGLC